MVALTRANGKGNGNSNEGNNGDCDGLTAGPSAALRSGRDDRICEWGTDVWVGAPFSEDWLVGVKPFWVWCIHVAGVGFAARGGRADGDWDR